MNSQPELFSNTLLLFFSHSAINLNPKSTLKNDYKIKVRRTKTRNDQKSILASFKEGRRRQQRKSHLTMELRVYVIISQLFQFVMPAKFIGIRGFDNKKKIKKVILYSRLPYNCKTWHFSTRKGRFICIFTCCS